MVNSPRESVTTATNTPLLTAARVTFGYETGQPVVTDLTLSLLASRVVTLIGPNAAGKSTLLRLLLGQLTPWSGHVTIEGKDVRDLPPRRRATWISYVPQRAGVSFAFTVEQVVAMGRFAAGEHPQAVVRAIEACDLSHLRHRVYAELSVGQQQRVLLARAMAQSAGAGKVMLLDEPGSAMDLRHVHQTMQLVRELADRGMAILVVLHDLNLAARYADDVCLMDQGRVAAQGSWREVLTTAVLEPVYRVKLTELSHESHGRPVFVAEPSDTLQLSSGT